jgi:hypothetical protein
MSRRGLGIVAVVAAAAVLAGPVSAEGYRVERSRHSVREAPVKDCTRLNGRVGYYGNPWCTPQEQARWDRWEASRLGLR